MTQKEDALKLKNMLQFLGLKGKRKFYGYNVKKINLGKWGEAKYAQWSHPKDAEKIFTEDMVNDYSEFLQPGDFCIDIGAHSGDSTLPMARAVAGKEGGGVLALEPNPYVFHVLEKTARSNRPEMNIMPMLAAAADSFGFVDFEYSDSGFCNGGKHENISALKHGHPFKLTVFTINLEEELQEDFSDYLPLLKFIKVDAEGYDLFILRSLRETINKYRPVIKAEVFKNTDRAYRLALLELFEDMNYTVHRIIKEPIQAGEEITIDNMQAWKHYDILCQPNKV